MPARDAIPEGSVKVSFVRADGRGRGWVFVPADNLARAQAMIAPLLVTVPDDATWTTEPPTPGLLPPDKESPV